MPASFTPPPKGAHTAAHGGIAAGEVLFWLPRVLELAQGLSLGYGQLQRTQG